MRKIKKIFLNDKSMGVDFSSNNFNFSSINKSHFKNCNFNNTLFKESIVYETIFENCTFLNCDFSGCDFKNVQFIKCNLDYSIFNISTFSKILFKSCACNFIKARGTHFTQAFLDKNNFIKCDLNRSFFEDSQFQNLEFDNCKMFMFFSFKTDYLNVNIKNSNLVLAKIINCKKINTNIMDNNKLLCFFEKNDIKFDNEKY